MKQTTPSRILAAWLCTLLVVPGILSCGDSADKPQSDATDAVTEAVVTTEAPDPRLSVSDDLPERDWGGDTFMILTHSETYYCVEEETATFSTMSISSGNRLSRSASMSISRRTMLAVFLKM